ncbi:MAG: hypothetical protein K2K53_09310, partial [Oscillospiraceae bacterium]|nr:hypothetical protein [Oscillospiraceae bacterium]
MLMPFQVNHDTVGLSSLVKILCSIGGEIRAGMGHTGMYWRPITLLSGFEIVMSMQGAGEITGLQ